MRSYKLRGAYNLLMQLSDARDGRRGGVLVGGQPRAGLRVGVPVDGHPRPGLRPGQDAQAEARPDPLPRRRVHRADRRSARPTTTAAAAALDDVARTGATLVPPYDDPRTMAGQGTIAVEILDQLDAEPDLVIVPVGGGGCIAGITTYLAERTTQHLGARRRAGGRRGDDGRAGRGRAGHARARRPVRRRRRGRTGRARCRTRRWPPRGTWCRSPPVDEGAVCTAMLDLYQNEGIIAEPAGALSVAALLEADIEPGSTVVCLISGGNNDVSRYGEILERSLVHLGLKHYFLVDFPQEPGALRRFLDDVLGPERRHHPVRVRQAQQPGDRRGAGRHRARLGRRPGGSARADAGLRHPRRAARAGLAGLPLPDLSRGLTTT